MAEAHKNQYQIVKLDIKDFFPNCTFEFIMKSMSCIYPFSLIDRKMLETIIKPCMIYYDYHYRLPQGAPSSPILSNIAMIPIDYELLIDLSFAILGYGYTYTRFADDIIISNDGSIVYANVSPVVKSCQSFNPAGSP